MKGLVFRELVDLVEAKFGDEVLDDVLEAAHLPASKGAYTSVGTYPFEEMLELLTHLSARVEVPAPDLLFAFGEHLLGQFFTKYPRFFEEVGGTFEFVEHIDDHIHVEVKKLYPDAELPRFETAREGARLIVEYRSPRALADLARGLLTACIRHFHEPLVVRTESTSEDGTVVRFNLEPPT